MRWLPSVQEAGTSDVEILRERGLRQRELRIETYSLLIEPAGVDEAVQIERPREVSTLQIRFVRIHARRVPCRRPLAGQLRLQHGGNRRRDLVLHGKDIGELAVPTLRPHRTAIGRIDQLGSHTNALPALPHASFEHVLDAELARDIADPRLPPFERERRGASGHLQPGKAREHVDHVLGEAVAEILLLPIAAHVHERQHRDRGPGVR